MGLGSSVGVLRAEGGLPLPGREVVGRGPGRCDSGRGTDDPRRWEEGQRRATPSVAPASPGSLGGAGGRGGGLGFRSLQPLLEELPGAQWRSPRRVPGSGLWGGPSDIAPGAGWNLPCRGRGRAELPAGPRVGGDPASGGARARWSRAGVAEAAGDRVPRPRDVIRIRRSNQLRAGADPGGDRRAWERQRPAFSGYGGEVGPRDRAAGRGGVVDSGGLGWAKRSVARVALAQLETLESAPTPLGAAAAAK